MFSCNCFEVCQMLNILYSPMYSSIFSRERSSYHSRFANCRTAYVFAQYFSRERSALDIENARTPKVSTGEGNRGQEMNEGSLMLCIVAIERRGTYPKDPLISQGGGRSMGAYAGPTQGHQSHEKRINETIKHSDLGWNELPANP